MKSAHYFCSNPAHRQNSRGKDVHYFSLVLSTWHAVLQGEPNHCNWKTKIYRSFQLATQTVLCWLVPSATNTTTTIIRTHALCPEKMLPFVYE